MSPICTTPQEVIDLFIAELFVFGGKKALSSVALSSTLFLHPARLYLFGSLNLQFHLCPRENLKDWETLQSILLQSPSIKHCVRDVSIGSFIFCDPLPGEPHWDKIWCGAHRPCGYTKHFLTRKLLQDLDKRKIPCMLNVLPSLCALRAIRVNYGLDYVDDSWRSLPGSAARSGILSLLSPQAPITTLTLSSIQDVPISAINLILEYSQLTALMFEEILIDNDVPAESYPRKSYLTNLHTFGLVAIDFGVPAFDIGEVADLIVRSASHSLRVLSWYNWGGTTHGNKANLPNLKTYLTNTRSIRPALLQIIERNRQKLEVFEIFVDFYSSECEVEQESTWWSEVDEFLEDKAFSNLQEIRFLVKTIYKSGEIIDIGDGKYCPTDRIGAIFKSFVPKTSARGIRFSYGLRYDLNCVLYPL